MCSVVEKELSPKAGLALRKLLMHWDRKEHTRQPQPATQPMCPRARDAPCPQEELLSVVTQTQKALTQQGLCHSD